MPELPEVQCVVNTLARIKGKTFAYGKTLNNRLREPVQPGLHEKLRGRQILDIQRVGKYILFHLDQGYLVVHLGMTGSLLIDPEPSKHDRIELCFTDGSQLIYKDVRKFGLVLFEDKLEDNKYLRNLGVEPLSEDFSPDRLLAMAQDCRKEMKVFLLDQRYVTGLGNIYVNELLYDLRINPFKKAWTLTAAEAERMVPAIKTMLLKSIEMGGSSISDYVDADNKKGGFQATFSVYQKAQDPLGNPVTSETQGGRSTFYVPNLQGLKPAPGVNA
jgi:formamidopyrimidine-DNA glycosylase